MTDLAELERRLWAAADELRANSSLTPADYPDIEYSTPESGLPITLQYAVFRPAALYSCHFPAVSYSIAESLADPKARKTLPNAAALAWSCESREKLCGQGGNLVEARL